MRIWIILYRIFLYGILTDYYIDKLFSFNAGGNFNYGRDPGWKVPGRPIINPLNNNTIGRPNIYFKITHITNDYPNYLLFSIFISLFSKPFQKKRSSGIGPISPSAQA